jgi:hypothetical protein
MPATSRPSAPASIVTCTHGRRLWMLRHRPACVFLPPSPARVHPLAAAAARLSSPVDLRRQHPLMPVCGCSSFTHAVAATSPRASRLLLLCRLLAVRRAVTRAPPFIRACNTSCGWLVPFVPPGRNGWRVELSRRPPGARARDEGYGGGPPRQPRGEFRWALLAGNIICVLNMAVLAAWNGAAAVGKEKSSWGGVRAMPADMLAETGCAGQGQCVGVGSNCAYCIPACSHAVFSTCSAAAHQVFAVALRIVGVQVLRVQ